MKLQTEQDNYDRLIFENVYVFNDDLTEKEKTLREKNELKANAKYVDGVVWSCLIKRKMLEDRGGDSTSTFLVMAKIPFLIMS